MKTKIVGFKLISGVVNGRDFANVHIQTAEKRVPLDTSLERIIYGDDRKTPIGTYSQYGQWVQLNDSKIKLSDALALFGVSDFTELLSWIGREVDLSYNQYGSIVCVEVI